MLWVWRKTFGVFFSDQWSPLAFARNRASLASDPTTQRSHRCNLLHQLPDRSLPCTCVDHPGPWRSLTTSHFQITQIFWGRHGEDPILSKNIFRETVEYYCADFLPRGGGSSFSYVLNAITCVIQLYRDKKLVDSGYKEKEHEKPLRTLVRLVSDICKVYGAEREEGRVEPESGSGQRNFDGLTLWRERLLCSPPWKGTTISLPKSTKHIQNI